MSTPYVAVSHQGTTTTTDDFFYCDLGPYGGGQILQNDAGDYYVSTNPYIKVVPTVEFKQFRSWKFIMPDGSILYFGENDNSRRSQLRLGNVIAAYPANIAQTSSFVYRYDLSRVTDFNGTTSLRFGYSKIEETVALNITSATVDLSYKEDYGLVAISAEAQDGYELELFFNADELNGTFTENDFYSDGVYVYNYVEWGDGDEDWAPLEKMNLVGALNEEGTEYAFSGSVVGSNAVEYTFNAIATIAAEEEEGGEDAAFAPKRVVKKAALKESAKKRASLK